MDQNQYGFSAIEGIIIVTIVALLSFVGWSVWQGQNKSDTTNTPRKNKEIEVQAAKEKNVSKCGEIKGNSYNFGPVDEVIAIPEAEAKHQCRENIEKGITPSLVGG